MVVFNSREYCADILFEELIMFLVNAAVQTQKYFYVFPPFQSLHHNYSL